MRRLAIFFCLVASCFAQSVTTGGTATTGGTVYTGQVFTTPAVCTGYTYRRLFVIPHQSVGATLADFPVELAFNGASALADDSATTSFTDPDFKVVGSGGKVQSSSGYDIQPCDNSGNPLPFHRNFYDGTTGKLDLRVDATLSSTSDNFIWLYYGKVGAVDQSNPHATYVGFNQVLSFGDGTTLSVADLTSNGNNGTNVGGSAATVQETGGVQFTTQSQYVALANAVGGTSQRTISFWASSTGTGNQVLYDQGTLTAGNRFLVYINASNQIQVDINGFTDMVSNRTFPRDGRLHKITLSVTSGLLVTLYIDGIADNSTTYASLNTGGGALLSQNVDGGGAGTVGKFDELRISTTARSSEWEAAEYFTNVAPYGFAYEVDASTPAGLASGNNCIPINIDPTQVPNTDRTNYVFTFRGRYAWAALTTHSGYALSANNIRFYGDSGCTTTALSFNRSYYDGVTGDLKFKVLLPSVSHTATTTFYVSVGNPSYTTDVSSDTVFTSTGTVGKYFLASDYSTLDGTDHGSAGLTLNSFGPLPQPTAAYTPLGPGAYFPLGQQALMAWVVSGGSDHLGAHGYPVGTVHRSESSWFQVVPNSWLAQCGQALTGAIVGFGNSDVQPYSINYGTNALCGIGGTIHVADYAKLGTCIGPSAWDGTDGTPNCYATSQQSPQGSPWFSPNNDLTPKYVVSVFPSDGGTLNSVINYVNGVAVTSPYTSGTGTLAVNTTDTVGATCGLAGSDPCSNIEIGGGPVSNDWNFYGYIFEPEPANTNAWTADQIKTQYNNQASPWTFYSFGTATH